MSGFDDDEPVLGAPPAMPDDVWDRVLASTFEAAPEEDVGAELLPQDADEPVDAAGAWDADLDAHHDDAGDIQHDQAHDWDQGDHGL